MSSSTTAPGTVPGVVPWIMLIGGIGAQFADVMLAKAVLDIVVNSSQWVSWTVAVVISLSADLTAIWAGRSQAGGNQGQRWTAVTGWVVVGTAIFLVRYHATALGDVTSTPTANRVMAILLGALYIAAGMACAHASAILFHPERARYRAATKRITTLREELCDKEAVYTRLVRAIQLLDQERDSYVRQRGVQAHETAEGLAARLADHARQRILSYQDSPAAAPLVRAPHTPATSTPPAPHGPAPH